MKKSVEPRDVHTNPSYPAARIIGSFFQDKIFHDSLLN